MYLHVLIILYFLNAICFIYKTCHQGDANIVRIGIVVYKNADTKYTSQQQQQQERNTTQTHTSGYTQQHHTYR